MPKPTEEDILIGLFPMERIFLAGPNRSDLYSNDTGGRLLFEEKRIDISPMDIIGATYGANIGKGLQLLCQEHGLE